MLAIYLTNTPLCPDRKSASNKRNAPLFVMKPPIFLPPLLVVILASLAFLAAPRSVQAGGHSDAPALAQDAGANIGDLFAFLDPNDNTEVVLIGTIHPHIVPGEATTAAVFDPNVRYRFEIYNDHVNATSPVLSSTATATQIKAYVARIKPARTIDVTFTKRAVGSAPQSNPANGNPLPVNLRRPLPQQATVTLGGFAGVRDHGIYPGVQVSPFGVGAAASPLQVYEIAEVTPDASIRVFAGLVDDPFFFDVPAFSGFLDSVRNGSPSTAAFSRGRDTFAGYNILAIAVRLPKALLVNANAAMPVIGVDFLTQRHVTEVAGKDGPVGSGAIKTVDRIGNPEINYMMVPYDQKDAYNAASPKDDASGKFSGAIMETLNEFGLSDTEPAFATLTNLAIAKGDLLQLDTSVSNTGTNASGGFPNGRRVTDDVIDYVLTKLNHTTTLTDNVNGNDSTIPTTFPFLALPHQPLFSTNVDDGTRN